MSRPRHSWYPIVQKVLRNYPELYRRREQLRQQSITPGYTGMPGGGGVNRKTESVALRELKPREESDLEAVLAAIQTVGKWKDGATILRMVELVDWRMTHTIQGAERELHLGEDTGKRMRRRFMDELARNLGYW